MLECRSSRLYINTRGRTYLVRPIVIFLFSFFGIFAERKLKNKHIYKYKEKKRNKEKEVLV